MCSCVRLGKMSTESGLVQGCLWREGGMKLMEKVPLEVDLVSEGCGAQILEVSRADFKVYTLTSFRL